LRNELESGKHNFKLQITECKMEAVKNIGAIERERDSLRSHVDGECDMFI